MRGIGEGERWTVIEGLVEWKRRRTSNMGIDE